MSLTHAGTACLLTRKSGLEFEPALGLAVQSLNDSMVPSDLSFISSIRSGLVCFSQAHPGTGCQLRLKTAMVRKRPPFFSIYSWSCPKWRAVWSSDVDYLGSQSKVRTGQERGTTYDGEKPFAFSSNMTSVRV